MAAATRHFVCGTDTYIHHVPGRLRVRSGLVKGDDLRAAEAIRWLQTTPGVRSAKANTLTGSLTILYDASLTSGVILLQNLKQAGWVTAAAFCPPPPAVQFRSEAGARIARKVALYALEALAERSLAALVAAVI